MLRPAQAVKSLDLQTLDMMRRWAGMWDRCYNPENPSYAYYGARGIGVCSEWLSFKSFLAFWNYPPFDGASMGRINNDGHYEPANCEWQNQEQQNNNTVRSRIIQWNGKSQSIRDWAKEYGIGTRRLSERLRRGWEMERALKTPCPKGFDGELEERRCRHNAEWSLKGHLYSARSRWRRGLRLSLPTQDLLAVEGVEPSRDDQLRKAKSQQRLFKPTNAKPTNTRRRMLTDDQKHNIQNMKASGASIRQIAAATGIPKSTVHYFLAMVG